MSESFGAVELDKLVFPAKMRIDHVRVYQPNDQIRTGCDPADHPTADCMLFLPSDVNGADFLVPQTYVRFDFVSDAVTVR